MTSATVHGLGSASWFPAASSLFCWTRDVSFALSADIFDRSLDRCFDDSKKKPREKFSRKNMLVANIICFIKNWIIV